ncbi:MAG: HAD family hydrolase [Planctomycetes bacterium]|nr:HAD family hydrolase [Planctomycetota bacterium]MCB9917945.1 HAD family hydrolase [Planctomycetota bacterium]
MIGDRTPIRAVLFDVDGTLYHQGVVRRRMAAALLRRFAFEPRRARERLRNLSCWRAALEALRPETADFIRQHGGLRSRQRSIALQNGAIDATLDDDVDEWMATRALEVLKPARREGLVELLASLTDRGVLLGAWSDYPCDAKLEALDVAEAFSVRVSADDVDCLKPWPHGFHLAARRLGVPTRECLYVGDRADVDAAGAAAAGMRCVLFGRPGASGGVFTVRTPADLRDRLLAFLDNG